MSAVELPHPQARRPAQSSISIQEQSIGIHRDNDRSTVSVAAEEEPVLAIMTTTSTTGSAADQQKRRKLSKARPPDRDPTS